MSCRDLATKAQFDTNVFALLRIIRAALPKMRAQGFEYIMDFSSIGGLRGYNPFQASPVFASLLSSLADPQPTAFTAQQNGP